MKKITLVEKIEREPNQRDNQRKFVLPNLEKINIGRSRRNDIIIPDCPLTNTVSGMHCSIQRYEDGTAYVSDNESKYGTYLNKRKLKIGEESRSQSKDIWQIRNNDVLKLGDYKLQVRIEEERAVRPGK